MLTLDIARNLFHYDEIAGQLFWKVKRSSRVDINKPVGCKHHSGYLQVTVNRKQYRVHRVIWLMAYGSWPTFGLDHINGIKDDNRICNLRDVDLVTNRENLRVANVDNKSGFLGVSYNEKRRKYRAQIRAMGRYITLGYFQTPQEAHNVYVDAKRKYHRGNTL